MTSVRLPYPCLVVLAGPSGSGKSTWAAQQFRSEQVVSADALRALVGMGPSDQRAGKDAFDVLDLVVERRLRRGLLTVVDSLGMDAKRRRRYLDAARTAGVPCHAVVFDTPPQVCRQRNKAKGGVPAAVLSAQLRRWPDARAEIADEPFDGTHSAGPVTVVPAAFAAAPAAAARQGAAPMPLRFGLQIPRFELSGGPGRLRQTLADVVRAAEDAGFSSVWVMDHVLQIPQVGREWENMLEGWTTLAFLAGHTSRVRLGTLVTGVTYRNIAHLGKIAATLDVLSGGRLVFGIGAAWFEREHRLYGYPFPPLRERYEQLEDALQLLPLLWGPGSPTFAGRTITVPEAVCYPRPLQDPIPILVGGSGEKRTLRLVAQYADACNLVGDVDRVRHKVAVLHDHCADVDRDPAEITVTHLSTVLVGRDPGDVAARVAAARPSSVPAEQFAARVNAATADDHVGRFRLLAEAGVQTAIVSLADLDGPEAVERFAPVIDAFPPPDRAW